MEFYRIEYMLKNFEEALDEEEKQYKTQIPKMSDYKTGNTNYGGFKTPKIDLPKISPPKLR